MVLVTEGAFSLVQVVSYLRPTIPKNILLSLELSLLPNRNEKCFDCRQICDAISILSTFYPDDKKRCHELVDKLWSGIMDKSQEINVDSIAKVFNTLPHLKQVITTV